MHHNIRTLPAGRGVLDLKYTAAGRRHGLSDIRSALKNNIKQLYDSKNYGNKLILWKIIRMYDILLQSVQYQASKMKWINNVIK